MSARMMSRLARQNSGVRISMPKRLASVAASASPVEARLCAGEEVALVGGGNSAGQAVVYLAGHVRKVHMIVRGDGLAQSMSRYLVQRIAALPM